MSDDVRALNELALAFARQSARLRRRVAALRTTGEKERIAGELKKYAGLEQLLAATDGLGKRPDPDSETPYDKIRRAAGQRQQADQPDRAELQRRLRMGR